MESQSYFGKKTAALEGQMIFGLASIASLNGFLPKDIDDSNKSWVDSFLKFVTHNG